ncbi:PRD domain-containing protein [Geomicrobium sp. JCM 19039]|uniref:PRD domain-containing protein n=1 Tax=Geomicrobium sp. JCM 19039 TaxID=1460636 RepID=UPI00045F174E|nr:PRD domain-containing protein [Geomicrobium sp. JCM 19039]GAK13224.1 PTS-regulatory domain protein [Geomicrobium sp. JCM 19039]
MSIQERLELLLNGDVISQKAASITSKAADRLPKNASTDHVTMLITHLATALTRIERGEELDKPAPALVKEVEAMSIKPEIQDELVWIEEQVGSNLPEEERIFLKIHYATLFNQ